MCCTILPILGTRPSRWSVAGFCANSLQPSFERSHLPHALLLLGPLFTPAWTLRIDFWAELPVWLFSILPQAMGSIVWRSVLPCPCQPRLLALDTWDKVGGAESRLWRHTDLSLNPSCPQIQFSKPGLLICNSGVKNACPVRLLELLRKIIIVTTFYWRVTYTRRWPHFILFLTLWGVCNTSAVLAHSRCSTFSAPLFPSVSQSISSKEPPVDINHKEDLVWLRFSGPLVLVSNYFLPRWQEMLVYFEF